MDFQAINYNIVKKILIYLAIYIWILSYIFILSFLTENQYSLKMATVIETS